MLVVNTQAFRSVEFFQHALVANAQAKLQFEECFRHSLVSECISRSPSERSFSHALVADTRAELQFGIVFQTCVWVNLHKHVLV